MNFQFESLRDFALMNGHGPYVWAAYGISFAVLIYLVIAPLWRQRRFIRQHRARLRKLARIGESPRQS